MAQKVLPRAARRKARVVARAEQRAQQQAVRQQLLAAIAAVVTGIVEQALEAEVTALLGRAKYARRAAAPPRPAGVVCSRCGLDWGPRLWRDGHYARTLLLLLAAVRIRVPRLGCRCGGTVPLAFATFGPYQRSWLDLQERARQLAGLCLSLRDVREVLAMESGQPVACSTLNSWVQQAAPLAQALRAGPLERVPPVVLLDGLWVKLMRETGEDYRDTRGRKRRRRRRVSVPLLVAYGVDPGTGEQWLLDWELGEQEDEASWRRLLERLHTRGLRAETGLDLFVHDGSGGLDKAFGLVDFGPGVLRQRCVFHVLRNLRDAVQGEPGMDREAKRARRREVLQDAAAIWQAADRTTVYGRREAFVQKWGAREPKAVARLKEVWPHTLAYLAALERGRERGETWGPRYLRTTSALERANRALRQKARQVGTFQAEAGLLAALALVSAHRALGLQAAPDELWTEVLEAGLLAA
jgi:transposase-like protein